MHFFLHEEGSPVFNPGVRGGRVSSWKDYGRYDDSPLLLPGAVWNAWLGHLACDSVDVFIMRNIFLNVGIWFVLLPVVDVELARVSRVVVGIEACIHAGPGGFSAIRRIRTGRHFDIVAQALAESFDTSSEHCGFDFAVAIYSFHMQNDEIHILDFHLRAGALRKSERHHSAGRRFGISKADGRWEKVADAIDFDGHPGDSLSTLCVAGAKGFNSEENVGSCCLGRYAHITNVFDGAWIFCVRRIHVCAIDCRGEFDQRYADTNFGETPAY